MGSPVFNTGGAAPGVARWVRLPCAPAMNEGSSRCERSLPARPWLHPCWPARARGLRVRRAGGISWPGAIGAPAAEASGGHGPTLVPGAVTAPPLIAGQLELTAFNIDFEPKVLVAPSGPLELRFHNRDNGIPHNVAINDAHGGSVFEPEIFVGPASVDYSIPDLAPVRTPTCARSTRT